MVKVLIADVYLDIYACYVHSEGV